MLINTSIIYTDDCNNKLLQFFKIWKYENYAMRIEISYKPITRLCTDTCDTQVDEK